MRLNPSDTELGFAVLHGAPPPVQADAGRLITLVAEVVETVSVLEQVVPSVAPEQVYVSWPEEIEGPPLGVKSAVAFVVMFPLPEEVVRAL
ncbi:MAG: hypothetical protein LAN70_10450 [Acidobacteriia bacterium]|nr:hypothetical protein [Terriglobia bacterium]